MQTRVSFCVSMKQIAIKLQQYFQCALLVITQTTEHRSVALMISRLDEILMNAKLAQHSGELPLPISYCMVQRIPPPLVLDYEGAFGLEVEFQECDVAEHCGLNQVCFTVRFYRLRHLSLRVNKVLPSLLVEFLPPFLHETVALLVCCGIVEYWKSPLEGIRPREVEVDKPLFSRLHTPV